MVAKVSMVAGPRRLTMRSAKSRAERENAAVKGTRIVYDGDWLTSNPSNVARSLKLDKSLGRFSKGAELLVPLMDEAPNRGVLVLPSRKAGGKTEVINVELEFEEGNPEPKLKFTPRSGMKINFEGRLTAAGTAAIKEQLTLLAVKAEHDLGKEVRKESGFPEVYNPKA